MEQSLDIQAPTNKVYKDKAIWVGTFLGGPLIAGYLISENFKVFNENDKVKNTWIYAIIATVVVFGGVFMIPETVKIPNQIIPLIYTAIAFYLVKHYQGQNIEKHINNGGEFHNWWRTIGVSIVGLIITLIPVLGFAFISDAITSASEVTKTYGMMNHEITFDKSNISGSEVDKLANGLTTTTFFDQAVTKYVYAEKEKENYELYLSVVDGMANDNQALEPFVQLRNDLQTLFPDNKISFNLVVDNLDNVVKRIE